MDVHPTASQCERSATADLSRLTRNAEDLGKTMDAKIAYQIICEIANQLSTYASGSKSITDLDLDARKREVAETNVKYVISDLATRYREISKLITGINLLGANVAQECHVEIRKAVKVCLNELNILCDYLHEATIYQSSALNTPSLPKAIPDDEEELWAA